MIHIINTAHQNIKGLPQGAGITKDIYRYVITWITEVLNHRYNAQQLDVI